MHIQNGSARGGEQAALEVAEFVPECHLGRSFRNLQRISSSGVGSAGFTYPWLGALIMMSSVPIMIVPTATSGAVI